MERDDLIEYSLDGHHSEKEGKAIRKKIWMVTLILTVVTALEVGLGAYIKQSSDIWLFVKWTFVALTLLKAGYIVMVFMHLGDERPALQWTIILPAIILIPYLLFILLTEGGYTHFMRI